MSGILTGKSLILRDKVSNNKHSTNHLKRHNTIADELKKEGYATGAFCPNAYSSRYYGFDQGFDHFEDFLFQNNIYQQIFKSHLSDSAFVTLVRNIRNYILRQEAFKTWDTYIDDIEEWVSQQQDPFFLWTFSMDTHFPYITPKKHQKWGSLFDMYYYNWRCNQLIDEFDVELSQKEKQKMINIYDDSIRFGDMLLQEIQKRLDEYNPIYIIFGDHGEAFDERGLYGHFYPSLYEENIHVPLVIAGKGVPSVDIKQPVSLLQIPSFINSISNDNFNLNTDKTVITSSDYDGRWERELTAKRVGNWKVIREKDQQKTNYEYYNLQDDISEKGKKTGNIGENKDVLKYVAKRKAAHENEIINIRSACKNLVNGENKYV
jgi:arylsulfatase